MFYDIHYFEYFMKLNIDMKPNMTFQKYAETIFKVLLTYFTFFKRIDIVFDVYLPNSLKAATTEKRGRGVRKRVSAEN